MSILSENNLLKKRKYSQITSTSKPEINLSAIESSLDKLDAHLWEHDAALADALDQQTAERDHLKALRATISVERRRWADAGGGRNAKTYHSGDPVC